MQLTDDDIREFQGIWQLEFQEDLSPDEARHHATRLLTLYEILASPLPSERGPDETGSDPPS